MLAIDMEEFDYKIIQNELHSVLTAIGYKLEREWPRRYTYVNSGQMIILQFYRFAVNIYTTIVFVCSDVPDGSDRRPSLALAIPPLNRTILEILISVLYLLEDLPTHIDLFHKAAWRDEKEMIKKYTERYGGSEKWDKYIQHRIKYADLIENSLGVTGEEKQDLNKILRWPKPNKIINRLEREYPGSLVIPFIKYLDDWLYRELSTQSHVEPRGLMQMGKYFLGMHDLIAMGGDDIEAQLKEKLEEFRTLQLWIAITLIMSLASEIEIHFRYEMAQRLAYVWTIININDTPREIYDERYKELLVPSE